MVRGTSRRRTQNKAWFHTNHIFPTSPLYFGLLPFLPLPLPHRLLTPQPNSHKPQPSHHRDSHPSDPHPRPTDLPTPRPLIMCKVPDRDLPLHIHVCQKGPLVVDAEIEDSVLVGEFEGCGEDGRVGGCVAGEEGEPVEGGEHAEF